MELRHLRSFVYVAETLSMMLPARDWVIPPLDLVSQVWLPVCWVAVHPCLTSVEVTMA